MMDEKSGSRESWLLCRAGSYLCALPLARVVEVMRPLPIEPMADAPVFLLGLSVIRGAPVAVIDLGHLLGHAKTAPTRLVTVRVGERMLGLAVSEVIAVRGEDEVGRHAAVPLLGQVAQDAVSTIGTLDSKALLFLQELRLLTERVPA